MHQNRSRPVPRYLHLWSLHIPQLDFLRRKITFWLPVLQQPEPRAKKWKKTGARINQRRLDSATLCNKHVYGKFSVTYLFFRCTFKQQRTLHCCSADCSQKISGMSQLPWRLCGCNSNSSEKMRHILSLGQSTIAGGPEKTIDLYGKLSS